MLSDLLDRFAIKFFYVFAEVKIIFFCCILHASHAKFELIQKLSRTTWDLHLCQMSLFSVVLFVVIFSIGY